MIMGSELGPKLFSGFCVSRASGAANGRTSGFMDGLDEISGDPGFIDRMLTLECSSQPLRSQERRPGHDCYQPDPAGPAPDVLQGQEVRSARPAAQENPGHPPSIDQVRELAENCQATEEGDALPDEEGGFDV